MSLTLIPIVCLLIVIFALVIKPDKLRSSKSTIISRIIIGLLLFTCVSLSLSMLALKLKQNQVANCPTELINLDSTFGNSCKSEIGNPIEKLLINHFSGPFRGAIEIFFILPITLLLSIFGIILEVKNIKKNNQQILIVLKSISLITFISLLVILILIFVSNL